MLSSIWGDDIVYDNEGGPATECQVLKYVRNGTADLGNNSGRQKFYTLVHKNVSGVHLRRHSRPHYLMAPRKSTIAANGPLGPGKLRKFIPSVTVGGFL